MTLADALVLAYSVICTQVLMKNYPTSKHTTIDSQQLRLEGHQKFKESGFSFSHSLLAQIIMYMCSRVRQSILQSLSSIPVDKGASDISFLITKDTIQVRETDNLKKNLLVP